MSITETLDIEALVAPISPERPCGASQEHDEDSELMFAFSQMQLDFDTARKIERGRAKLDAMTAEQRRLLLADAAGRSDDPRADPRWSDIAKQAATILSKLSKDMRVVVVLIESQVRSYGFAGLRDALRCCEQLIEKYPDELFPLGDSPEDKLYRYNCLNNLNNSTSLLEGIQRVSFIPAKPFHFAGHAVAQLTDTLALEEQKERRDAGVLLLDDFKEMIEESSPEEIESYLNDIDEARKAAKAVDQLLGSVSGKANYGLTRVLNQLDEVHTWFKYLTEDRISQSTSERAGAETASPDAARTTATGAIGTGDGTQGALRTREDALNSLLRVAKFFRSTEPHSPLSYALEQAVRWGKMGLPDLMRDLVRDDEVLREVFRRMGIEEKAENRE